MATINIYTINVVNACDKWLTDLEHINPPPLSTTLFDKDKVQAIKDLAEYLPF